jgi:uncharacterized protein YbjT (DUF2867 family)
MKVLLFGATGMIGQGVLRECLRDPQVAEVVALVRRPTGQTHAKLKEIVHENFFDYGPIERDLAGFDACFFCLGVSAAGLPEVDYQRLTYDLTLAGAETLARLNPAMTFVYVSGAGTDSTERGRTMWARVKGRTENALRRLPFRAVYLLRPGLIQPLYGIRSRTGWYQAIYTVLGPCFPLLRWLFPKAILTTEELGRAMLRVARDGAPSPVLEAADLIALGAPPAPAAAP